MAEGTTKKYLDYTGLGQYDAKIKELIAQEDATTLQAAQKYADDLGDNYDAAGSAATALSQANAYTDGKITEVTAKVETAQSTATSAATAASKAQTAADKAQTDVNNLKTYVGTIPESSTSTNVVDYINEKTSGIATDAALAELQAQVNTNKTDISNIKSDYLTSSDKNELQSNIDGVSSKVTTLVGDDANKSVRTIANEELAAQLIPEGAKESLDTLQEIAAWIQEHPDDASAMNQAITALENLVGTLPTGITSTTVVGYIQELVNAEKTRAEVVESGLDSRLDTIETKLNGTGDGSVKDMIDDAVAAEAAIRKSADDALTTKVNTAQSEVDALETLVGTLPTTGTNATTVVGYVDEKVAATNSKVDGLTTRVSTAEGKITTLEGKAHTHENKTVLDGINAQKVSNWDTAYTNTHTHSNLSVLNGINADKVSAWDSAEANANAYTNSKIAEFVPIGETEINDLFA